MEWLLVGVAVLAVVVLVGTRGTAPPPGHGSAGAVGAVAGGAASAAPTAAPGAAGVGSWGEAVLHRSLNPDDPDGAFMDGYVAGRYTERYTTPTHQIDRPGTAPPVDPPSVERTGDDDVMAQDSSEPAWTDEIPTDEPSTDEPWTDHPWPDQASADEAWETGAADDSDDW